MQSLRVSEQGICSNQKPIIGHSHTELKMEKAQCSRTSLVFNFHLRNDLDLLINEKNQIKVIRTYHFYFFHCRSQKKKKTGKSQANCYYANAASELLLGTSKQNTCRAMESSGN